MRIFRDLSIKYRLTAVTMLTSCVAVLLVSTVFFASEVITSRRAIVQELSTIAHVIRNNSTATLLLNDKTFADEMLSALRAKPNITAAYIYTKDDVVFAAYNSGSEGDNFAFPKNHKKYLISTRNGRIMLKEVLERDFRFLDDYVDLYTPIVVDGKVMGTHFLRSNVNYMYSRINRYFLIAGIVTALSFLVAFLLSSRLHQEIARPILHLANTMKSVKDTRHYSIQAEKYENDEVGILVDGFNGMLSQIQAREDGLRAARRHAEMANRAKTEFLATVSHELRTPLNAILGFSEIIKSELLGPIGTPRYHDYARDIHESGSHLLQVINDILDISKVEAGKLELSEEEVTVSDIIEKSVRLIMERTENAGLSVTVEVDPHLPFLHVDERLVKQSLINLLSNAVKFTPNGGRIMVHAFSQRDGAIAISIADTGIGIAKEDIPRILAPFGQVDSSLSRKYEGTGLGLPLVKSFIDLHGGSLEIQSEIGVGTTVTIRFPAYRSRGWGTAGAVELTSAHTS